MKARNSSVVSYRERKQTEDGENVFFKAFAKIFSLTSKKLFMAELLSNGLHEKVICCIIMLYLLKVD